MSIVLQGSTSGSITLQEPAIAGSTVLSLPATTGTVLTSASPASDLPSSINGPAFSAYQSTLQTLASTTFTKITFTTEEFDTNNNFASSTFTPTVAGYYQINGAVQCASTNTTVLLLIYKNGSQYKYGGSNTTSSGTTVSSLVYCNGTTDYIELYAYFAIGQNTQTGITSTYFNACMVRSA